MSSFVVVNILNPFPLKSRHQQYTERDMADCRNGFNAFTIHLLLAHPSLVVRWSVRVEWENLSIAFGIKSLEAQIPFRFVTTGTRVIFTLPPSRRRDTIQNPGRGRR